MGKRNPGGKGGLSKMFDFLKDFIYKSFDFEWFLVEISYKL